MNKKYNKKKTNCLYQKDLIAKVAMQTSLSKKKVQKAISAFKLVMLDAITSGDRVQLREFGTFSVKERKSHLQYSVKEKRRIVIPSKKYVKFTKSSSWQLPEVKVRTKVVRSGEGISLEKKIMPTKYRRNPLLCDDSLRILYSQLLSDKSTCLPYIWKLLISKHDYHILKDTLCSAVSDYRKNKKDIKRLLMLHADLFIIYIAEWYKREYSNYRGDKDNDPLRQLGYTGATPEYNLIWQYSSSVFNIQRFLYKSKMTNRTKHSLYVLGGIPLQFESKKLRAIIFNSINSPHISEELDDDDQPKISEADVIEDEEFLLENTYLRESIEQEDGSLRLFVEELKNGDYLDFVKNDEDYNTFIDNYLDFQQQYFRKEKFHAEWLLYYSKGCGILDRVLKVTLRNEYSNEKNNMYISSYRLHKWGIATDGLRDFDVCIRFDQESPIRLFHYSCVGANNYSCWNNKDSAIIDDVPSDLHEAKYVLRPCDGTNRLYELPLMPVTFSDIIVFFKTNKSLQWTSNSYINSTNVAILYSSKYKVVDRNPDDVLKLDNGTSYNWVAFDGAINVKNKFTGKIEEYNSKVGRIVISLNTNCYDICNAIPRKSIYVNDGGDMPKEVPIFILNSNDKLCFSEYDAQRGLCISNNLEEQPDVEITIQQKDKLFSYYDRIDNLQYGLFTVQCTRKNKKSRLECFCIKNEYDVVRHLETGSITFSAEFMQALGEITPVNVNISYKKRRYYDDLNISTRDETIMFHTKDDVYRIPVYRCHKDAYVVFFNGKATLVNHYNIDGVAHLYVSKTKQKEITKINHVCDKGVVGVMVDDVAFDSCQRKMVKLKDDRYVFSVEDNIENYNFVGFTITENRERQIKPVYDSGKYCIDYRENELVFHVINPYDEPIYQYWFKNPNLHLEAPEEYASLLCFCKEHNIEDMFLRMIDFQWLLGRDEDEKKVCERLPKFLISYIVIRQCTLDSKDYKFLHGLEKKYNFVWMFLLPNCWYRYCGIDKSIKEILLSVFTYGNESNEHLRAIAESVLTNVYCKNSVKNWVQHKRLGSSKNIGYMAAEYLMPILVKRSRRKMSEKSANTKNVIEFMERNFDPTNMTIERTVSFTGLFYDKDASASFRISLEDPNCINMIYNYLRRINFIR